MGFFFEEIFHFTKKAEFSLKGGWGTNIPSYFKREAGSSTFFVERPELPFLTSALYVEGKIESQAICPS